MSVSVLGIDIAKNTFQLHGVDSSGRRRLKQLIERDKLSAYVANLPRKNVRIRRLLQRPSSAGSRAPKRSLADESASGPVFTKPLRVIDGNPKISPSFKDMDYTQVAHDEVVELKKLHVTKIK